MSHNSNTFSRDVRNWRWVYCQRDAFNLAGEEIFSEGRVRGTLENVETFAISAVTNFGIDLDRVMDIVGINNTMQPREWRFGFKFLRYEMLDKDVSDIIEIDYHTPLSIVDGTLTFMDTEKNVRDLFVRFVKRCWEKGFNPYSAYINDSDVQNIIDAADKLCFQICKQTWDWLSSDYFDLVGATIRKDYGWGSADETEEEYERKLEFVNDIDTAVANICNHIMKENYRDR